IQQVPLSLIVESLRLERQLDRTPLVQVLVGDEGFSGAPSFIGRTCAVVPIDTATSKFDLSLLINGPFGEDTVQLEYASSLFQPQTIERLNERLKTLLAHARREPEAAVARLSVTPRAELAQLMACSVGQKDP